MNSATAINAYTKLGVELGVAAADPHKLISMLYQGAILAIANAKNAILRKDIPTKGASLSKAILILDEGLRSSLNKEVGGELAQNLAALYEYMSKRLLTANIKNDINALDEVSRLLNELKGAWEGIQPTAVSNPASKAVQPQPVVNKVQLVYGRV